MSITLKLVNLLDKINVQNYFIEKDNKVYFSPMRININALKIEHVLDKTLKVQGNSYKMNQFEKDILEELNF